MNLTKEQVEQWCEENNFYLFDITEAVEAKHLRKNDVDRLAARVVKVDYCDLFKKSREERIVFGRWLLWHYWKTFTSMTLKKIGETYYPRDHATVLNGLDRINNTDFIGWQREAIYKFESQVNRIHSRLGIKKSFV